MCLSSPPRDPTNTILSELKRFKSIDNEKRQEEINGAVISVHNGQRHRKCLYMDKGAILYMCRGKRRKKINLPF